MPLEAPATDLALQVNISNPNRRTIMAMVTTLDTGVGSVVDALKATQMFPNSIIVLTTDKCGATLHLYIYMCPGCVVKIGAPLGTAVGQLTPAAYWTPGTTGRCVDQSAPSGRAVSRAWRWSPRLCSHRALLELPGMGEIHNHCWHLRCILTLRRG